MAPQEVALWARNSGPVVLASDCDGLAEQITHNLDGILFPPGDERSIARAIDLAVGLAPESHQALRVALTKRVFRERDFVVNLGRLLDSLA